MRSTGSLFVGVAQLAERQPSKLDVAGSIPVAHFTRLHRLTAGRRPLKAEALGSNPTEGILDS